MNNQINALLDAWHKWQKKIYQIAVFPTELFEAPIDSWLVMILSKHFIHLVVELDLLTSHWVLSAFDTSLDIRLIIRGLGIKLINYHQMYIIVNLFFFNKSFPRPAVSRGNTEYGIEAIASGWSTIVWLIKELAQ